MQRKIAAALEVARGRKIQITFIPGDPKLKEHLQHVLRLRNEGQVTVESDDHVLLWSAIKDGKWPTDHRTVTLGITSDFSAPRFMQDVAGALQDIQVV